MHQELISVVCQLYFKNKLKKEIWFVVIRDREKEREWGIAWRQSKVQASSYKISTRGEIYNMIKIINIAISFI